jgi:protein-L-isoaspartate O-methyltransferase
MTSEALVKQIRTLRIVACAVALSAFTTAAFAQAAQAPVYEPQVGQAGKDVVWVPTPQALVDKMLDLAQVTPKDFLMDLGSGDGRTVITAAKRGLQAQGIEYNPDMVSLAQRNATTAGVGNRATFVKADLFETDFSKAQVITMFLLPSINMKLRPTILNMRPGTRIVSNT